MKTKIILALLSILGSHAFAQNHFTPVTPTGKPYHVIIKSVTVDSNEVKAGDEIALFDSSLCVGSVIVSSNNQSNIDIVAWEGDSEYNLPGFRSGDSIKIKLWSNLYGTYQEIEAHPQFLNGDGTFASGTFSSVIINETINVYPIINFSTTTVDVGAVDVGSSVNGFFTIYNIGNANLTVSSIILSDNQFSLISNSSFIIADNDSQQVTFRFTPNSAQPVSASLTINSNDPQIPQQIVTLGGQGTPLSGANIEISESNLNFGNINIGNVGKRTFQITNNGNDTLDIYSISSSNNRFTVSDNNFTVNAGASKTVEVTFAPSNSSTESGTLTISSNGSNSTTNYIALSGHGFTSHFNPVAPTGELYNIIITDVLVDSHSLTVGDEIALFDDTTCVGTNIYTGSYPITITAWRGNSTLGLDGFTDGDSIKFSLYATTWGNQHELIPTATWIDGDGLYGTGSLSSGNLSATSNLEPIISVTPDSLTFGNIKVGVQQNLPLSIFNNGSSDLEIYNISSDIHGFFPSLNSATIAANSSQQITVTFQPDSSMYFNGNIILRSNALTDSIVMVPVSGVGLPSTSPIISVAESEVVFTPSTVGDTSYYQLTIYNNGSSDLEIYSFNSSDVNFGVRENNLTVSANGSKTVTLFFEPNAEGSFNSLLTMNNNSSNNSVFSLSLKAHAFNKFFNVVEPTGLPYSILFERISFEDGIIPSVGDQIAFFDSALCVGVITITNTDSLMAKEISGIAWEEKPTSSLPGFKSGNKIQLRYYNKLQSKVFVLNDTLVVGDGNFGTSPYTSYNTKVTSESVAPILVTEIPSIITFQDSIYNEPNFGINNYFSHLYVEMSYSIEIIDTNAINANIINNTGIWIKPKDDWYGTTNIIIKAFDGYFEAQDTVSIDIKPVTPEVVYLASPANRSIGNTQPITVSWHASNRAEIYKIQTSIDSSFNTLVVDSSTVDTFYILPQLNNLTTYYWKITATNPGGTSSWSEVWNFETTDVISQIIPFKTDWNLISFNVTPTTNTPNAIFAPIKDYLIEIKDLSKSYNPAVPEFLNTLKSFADGHGYWVKLIKDTLLTVEGIEIDHSTLPISLVTGWNLIGYPLLKENNVEVALASILTELVEVKDLSTSFNPAVPPFLNTLAKLKPNAGYWMKVSADATLTYPTPILTKVNNISATTETYKKWRPTYYTNSMVFYAEIEIDNESIKSGFVGAFINDECRGVGRIITEKDKSYSTIVVNGNKKANVTFKVIRTENEEEILIEDTFEFTPGKTNSTISLLKGSTQEYSKILIPTTTKLHYAYPNPFNPSTQIQFDLNKKSDVKLTIYNMQGEVVKTLTNRKYKAGSYKISWNGTNNNNARVSSGIYFVHFRTENISLSNKIVLIK